MATLDLSRATLRINMLDPTFVTFGTTEIATSDLWSFNNTRSDDLQVEGQSMTFDKTGHAIKGKVHTIGIDLGDNDVDNPDILISGLNVKAKALDDGQVPFWKTVLEGNDTIIGTSNGSIGSILFGDGPSARHKATGGNDRIETGTDGSALSGDVWAVGNQAAPVKVKYTGGNDSILVRSPDAFRVVGDTEYVYGLGKLIGGNDTITLLGDAAVSISLLVGDAGEAGDGTPDQVAIVIGGNDTLIATDDAIVSLVGDVNRQRANSFVHGGDDHLSGGNLGEYLFGDVADIGNNRMVGGNDLLMGNGGKDILSGDFYGIGTQGSGVAGNDTLYGGSADDVLYGDSRDDTRTTGGNDKLYGGSGNDLLFGGTGNDTLDGGYGNDILRGGDGDDVYVANDPGDSVLEGGNGGVDTVVTTRTVFQLGDNFENVTHTGDRSFYGTGNALANTMKGSSSADTLVGGDGGDQLYGGAGYDELYGGNQDDVLIGGSGSDLLNGGDGFDIASYAGSEAGVSVALNASITASGDAVGDGFVYVEGLAGTRFADTLVGNNGFNSLDGSRGNDVLSGLGGTDVLVGGLGRDAMTGGADSDRFVFTDIADSGIKNSVRDFIVDFVQGQDLIDLMAIDANTKKAGDQLFKLLGKGTAHSDVGTGKIGWYQIDKAGAEEDRTILRINNDADAAVDMTIALNGLVNLTAGDFVL